MDKERLEGLILAAEVRCCRDALSLLLAAHSSPVFGAAKAIEHEVAAFHALTKLGFLSQQPDEYELVMALRITKSKARSLLYQIGLRRLETADSIDAALRVLFSEPRVMKDGENHTGVAYPVVRGIPLLRPEHGFIASRLVCN